MCSLPALPARPVPAMGRVFARVRIGAYMCVNYKVGVEEHVRVERLGTGELVADYAAANIDRDSVRACDYTLFSESHWFFVNPIHTLVQCYSPRDGRVYQRLAQGYVREVCVDGFKDEVSWAFPRDMRRFEY